MEYVWIVMLAIVYIIIWCNTIDEIKWDNVYCNPFEVKHWNWISFYEIWVWLHELALIVLFVFSLIKFNTK